MLGIGFESGGSRTTYSAIHGPEQQVVGGDETAASLADARNSTSNKEAIAWIVDAIRRHEDDEMVAWIGAAGFSGPTARFIESQFEGPLGALRSELEARGRSCEVFIANDAVSILKSPPLFGKGVAAIVGTGSVVLGAHPAWRDGVVKRGGCEWLVSDEGAGVWMTLQCIRLLLHDIQEQGSEGYKSVLLDRLADHLSLDGDELGRIPASHRAMAKAELIARRVTESRKDIKRFLAGFVYPDIFELAKVDAGASHDPLAAKVIEESVELICEAAQSVSKILAAATHDAPNKRESLPMMVGGKIASNPHYDELLRSAIASHCRYIESVESIGDAAHKCAELALSYLYGDARHQAAIIKTPDPLHPVTRLL